jgi:hypothetical protein
VRFFYSYNNGVTAIASEEVIADMEKEQAVRSVLTDENHSVKGRDYRKPLREGLAHLGKPVFTFVRPERFKDSPWFTGDSDLLESVLAFLG